MSRTNAFDRLNGGGTPQRGSFQVKGKRDYENPERKEPERRSSPERTTERPAGRQRRTRIREQDFLSKNPEPVQEVNYQEEKSYDDFGDLSAELEKINAAKQANKRKTLLSKIGNGLLVLACIYVGFLIFGVTVTNYHYSKSGKIEAERLTVQDIKEKKDFEKIQVMYEKCRMLFEEVLMMKYRYEQNPEDRTLSTEFEAERKKVDELFQQINGTPVSDKYTQIQNMMKIWLEDEQYSLANYCSHMSEGISKQSADNLDSAEHIYYTAVEPNFGSITSNIIEIGESINGVDVSKFKSWDPSTYAEKKIKGKE